MQRVLSALTLACFVTIGWGWRLAAREGAAVNLAEQLAPSFSLAQDDGVFLSLDELLASHRAAVLVFYRGHW